MPRKQSPRNKQSAQSVEESAQAILATTTHPALSPLRAQFRSLILSNPNHFGNLKDSTFTPVTVLNSNTEFEELTCVGFNSQFNRLEAVVAIKQAFGYGGDLCSS